MLRPGLRHNYNSTIENLASTYDSDRLAIIAIAVADAQMTVRGGQFGEDKLFEERGRCVVMLVVGGEEEEGKVWERLAIGYLSVESWDAMKPCRKAFYLA